jgi:ribosome maturation factor RimP
MSANEDGFVLQTKVKQTVEGSKRPKLVDVAMLFNYEEIKYTKYVISLK